MIEIAIIEQSRNPQATSSVHPLIPRPRMAFSMIRFSRLICLDLSKLTDELGRLVRVTQSRINTQRRNDPSQDRFFGPAPASSHYLPCHYFDYIAGTSTGGLIAIMLGRLAMTVDECLDAYEQLADGVFGHPRRFHIRKPPWIPRDKYDHTRLEKAMKEIIKQRNPLQHTNTMFRQPREDMCRT